MCRGPQVLIPPAQQINTWDQCSEAALWHEPGGRYRSHGGTRPLVFQI